MQICRHLAVNSLPGIGVSVSGSFKHAPCDRVVVNKPHRYPLGCNIVQPTVREAAPIIAGILLFPVNIAATVSLFSAFLHGSLDADFSLQVQLTLCIIPVYCTKVLVAWYPCITAGCILVL